MILLSEYFIGAGGAGGLLDGRAMDETPLIVWILEYLAVSGPAIIARFGAFSDAFYFFTRYYSVFLANCGQAGIVAFAFSDFSLRPYFRPTWLHFNEQPGAGNAANVPKHVVLGPPQQFARSCGLRQGNL
jgi:hypothetical protein